MDQVTQAHSRDQLDLSSLPLEVLTTILSHIPLRERLGTCALVCRSWATAGAGASKTLSVQLKSQAQADSLAAWLEQYGSGLEHLSVATDHQAYLLQLETLRQQQRADAPASESVDSLWAQLLGAQSKDQQAPQCLTARLPLPQLLGLRRLSLENVRVHSSSWPHKQPTATATAAAAAGNACRDSTPPGSSSSGAGGGADAAAESGPPPSDPAAAAAAPLSHLTHLHTDSSFVSLLRVLEGNLQVLSHFEALRITLGPCDSGFLGSYWTAHGNAAFQALSAHCGRLQKLHLGTSHVTADGLSRLSCLQRLRHVELHVPGGSVRRPASLATWLEHLPAQQLTQLVLEPLAGRAAGKVLNLGIASIGQLSRFCCLQHLEVSCGTDLNPGVLAPLTALTHLSLSEIDLAVQPSTAAAAAGALLLGLHPQPQPQQQLQPQQQQQQHQLQGSAAMLAVLPCLQELRVLQLSPGLLPVPHAPAEQYSALTASRHLTMLNLYNCQLPAGVAQAMFPRGSSLPALKSVRLPQPAARGSSADGLDVRSPFMSSGAAAALRAARDSSSSVAGTGGGSAGRAVGSLPFGPGSLDSLAAACPHLAQLWLTAAVSTDADLAPLRQLTALTELQLGGVVVDDAVSRRVLSGLSQLQRLDLVQCPRFTDAGLAYLTALTELTSLQVRDCGLSHCTAGLGQVLYMCRRQEGTCSGTPVWERLRQQCSNSRDCLLVMLQQRDEQLAAARAALVAAEARTAAAVEARAAGGAGTAAAIGCTTSLA